MKNLSKLIISFLFVVSITDYSYSLEKNLSLFTSLSYQPIKPRIGVEIDVRLKEFFMFDHKFSALYYYEKKRFIDGYRDSAENFVGVDTIHQRYHYAGLSYAFLPTFILWNKLFVGLGIQGEGSMGFTVGGVDFAYDHAGIINLGCILGSVRINTYITSNEQIGVGFSYLIRSYNRNDSPGQKNY